MNLDTGKGLFLSRHFKNAYTTRDIDAAARMFAARHGLRSFHFMRDIPFGPGATIDIGLAWAGDVMFDLIQPSGETENLYSTMLPPEGQLVRFHHLGHLIEQREEWDAVVAQATASGYPIRWPGPAPHCSSARHGEDRRSRASRRRRSLAGSDYLAASAPALVARLLEVQP